MRQPVLVHIHVPKTAGSSFRTLLQTWFGSDHENLYVDNTHFVYSEEFLGRFISDRPNLRSISSHFIRTFPPRIAGRETLYITFLRDPLEQFISYITYTRKFYDKIPDKDLLACLPPRAADLPLAEVARWLVSRAPDLPFSENYNVNFFARFAYEKLHGSSKTPDYRRCRLVLAKAVLDSFFLVGFAEKMNESQAALERLGAVCGIDVPQGLIAVENVSSEYRDDLRWTDSSTDVGARVSASLTEDRELYQWAWSRSSAAVPTAASLSHSS